MRSRKTRGRSPCGLDLAELKLIGALLAHNTESGAYWGRPDQFYKRQDRVADWIDEQIHILENRGTGDDE